MAVGDHAIGNAGKQRYHVYLEHISGLRTLDCYWANDHVRTIFNKIMRDAGLRDGLGIVQHLLRLDAKFCEELFGISALVFQDAFMGKGVKGDGCSGGNGQNRFRFVVGKKSPAYGVRSCRHIEICRFKLDLGCADRLLREWLKHLKVLCR